MKEVSSRGIDLTTLNPLSSASSMESVAIDSTEREIEKARTQTIDAPSRLRMYERCSIDVKISPRTV